MHLFMGSQCFGQCLKSVLQKKNIFVFEQINVILLPVRTICESLKYTIHAAGATAFTLS